jgi:hypothetical protein
MSLKFLNEGFELSQFNVLQESVVNQITSILNTLNEATMSDDDKRDNEVLRQILSKASDAIYDKRRALKWTPQELDIADKYNLTLPQRTTKWDGSKEITPLKDNDVDYERGFGRNRQVRNLEMELSQQRAKTNVADFIRKRKEKGSAYDRPYRQVDKYAGVDDVDTFGDTTFTHDNTGRFNQDHWAYKKAATLAGSGLRNADLTDVEKDRARKRPERGENANRFEGDYFAPAPDYEREHQVNNDEYWNGMKYQRRERIADNQQMTKDVRNMKDILQRRKRAQQFVDNSQAEQDAKINKLKSEYERRIDSLKKYYDDANQNSKSKIDRANNEIDALLKRGET